MANITCDWTAECEYCGKKLGSDTMDDKCPDRWDFDTERCEFCDEEVCDNCGDAPELNHHTKCKEDADAEAEAEKDAEESAEEEPV